MEYLDKLENKIENLIDAVKILKKENIELKTKLSSYEEKSIENNRDKDEIQKKVLGMIEMIEKMQDS